MKHWNPEWLTGRGVESIKEHGQDVGARPDARAGKPTEKEGMIFLLPLPPSVNHLFATRKGGRCKTKKYRIWLEEAEKSLRVQNVSGAVKLPCRIMISIVGRFNEGRDLDNMLKPILDFLVHQGIIEDDHAKNVRSVKIEYSPKDEQATCMVGIQTEQS